MGVNSLTSIVGGVIQITHPNQYFTALNQDFVPRNISGVATDSGGSLGSSTYRWSNLYTSGTIQIGTLANNNKIYESSSDLVFKTNDAQSLRIQNNGRAVFGTVSTSLGAQLVVYSSGTLSSSSVHADELQIQNSSAAGSNCGMTVISGNTGEGGVYFGDTDSVTSGIFSYNHQFDRFQFSAAGGSNTIFINNYQFGIGAPAPSGVELYVYDANPIFRMEDTNGSYYNWDFNNGILAETLYDGSTSRAVRTLTADSGGVQHIFNAFGYGSSPKFNFLYTDGGASEIGLLLQCGDSSVSSSHTMMEMRYSGDNDVSTAKYLEFTDGNGQLGYINAISATAVQYFATSDARLKENYSDFDGISIIKKMNPIEYSWKKTNLRDMGFLAQELYDICPNVVYKPENESDKVWAVDYGRITPYIVKALKELIDRVEVLENK